MSLAMFVTGAYVAGIILVAVLPLGSNGEISNYTVLGIRLGYIAHAALFFPWPFLGRTLKRKEPLWLLGGVLLAVAAEGMHWFLPWRFFTLKDMASNLLGLAGGYAVLVVVFKKTFQSDITRQS